MAPTTTTAVKCPLTRTISDGMNGDDVARIQQRLKDLNFDPGPIDGDYGMATTQAVWAFEKLVLHRAVPDVTSKVSPELWDTMQDPISILPRRPQATGSHLEVYLPEQVGVVFENNAPRLITHVSTGSNKEWCEVGFCSTAITPSGVYQLGRRVDGWDTGILGQMYNPIYFNYGVAVHGAYNVPLYPASHGCVRLPMHIAKYFPSLVKRGDQVFVFDGAEGSRGLRLAAAAVQPARPQRHHHHGGAAHHGGQADHHDGGGGEVHDDERRAQAGGDHDHDGRAGADHDGRHHPAHDGAPGRADPPRRHRPPRPRRARRGPAAGGGSANGAAGDFREGGAPGWC